MSSPPIPMPTPDNPPPLSAAPPHPTQFLTTQSSNPAVPVTAVPSIHITAPATPDFIGFHPPTYHAAQLPATTGEPDVVVIDGTKYRRESSQAVLTRSQVDQSASSRPRFHRLVEELADACNTSSAADTASPVTDPEATMAEILKNWNLSKSTGQSGASTPKAAFDDHEGEEDGSNKIKVTLIYDALQANQIDAPLGGRKIIHISQTKLERILGPETTKAKLAEIRNGSLTLQDVFPTTFNAIRKWLSGKAILHGLPETVRGRNALRELVYVYVQAARWGHRSIVHDSVNNMPLLGSPFEFLETCAIVYREGCAGVAFRNFFKKGLPVVLGNSQFDQTEAVPGVLKQSGELATDFAETMLGFVSQPTWAQYDGGAGWDHLHRPVPTGGIIPGPPLSTFDAESQPIRPRNWSSAHLRHGSEWGGEVRSESGTEGWGYPSAPPQYAGEPGHFATGQHVQFRTPSHELVQLSSDTETTASLEARLREVEKKLSEAQMAPNHQANNSGQVARTQPNASSLAVPGPKPSVIRGKPLATSSIPPAALLHPGQPPIGMPKYVPGFGYNRYVNVGNGVVHPTGPGPYGLAGRTMVAARDSNVWDCTMVFRAGDVIECVVPVEEGRSNTQHNPWNFSGQRLQGICRTQAGSFPASFVREANAPGLSAGPAMSSNFRTPTQAAPPPPCPQSASVHNHSQPPQPGNTAPAPKTTNAPVASASAKVAGNVDSSWFQSTTSLSEASEAAPRRGRSSSTPSTAFRVNEHKPGCPSAADWRRPCTCYGPSASGGGANSHAWKPSSVWTNDGWDAPEGGIREV